MSRREHQADTEASLHPSAMIPVQQLEAAAGFGRLVAMGIVTWQEVVPSLLRAAQENGYRGDESGARTLFAWRVRDSAREWEIRRAKADIAVRKAVAPLLRDQEPGHAVLGAALEENGRWDDALTREEVIAVARQEAAWWTRCNMRVLAHAA